MQEKDSGGTVTATITRTYDGLDRLTQEVTALGRLDYAYDNASRRTIDGCPGPVLHRRVSRRHVVLQPYVTLVVMASLPLYGIRLAERLLMAVDRRESEVEGRKRVSNRLENQAG